MKMYRMNPEDLDIWVKDKAEVGDVAWCKDRHTDHEYWYVYKGPDPNPAWWTVQEETINKYLEEINKLKIEDTTVNRRCENCKHWHCGGDTNISFCTHDEQKCIIVPKFTCCAKYEPKEKKSTPFDGVKFYLIDDKSGELGIKYVCEDCGKIMDEPGHWWLALPLRDINGKQTRPFGYHFRCEECDKKKDGKI